MSKITVCAILEHRQIIMDILHKSECVQIEQINNDNKIADSQISENLTEAERKLVQLSNTLDTLSELAPEKHSIFKTRKSAVFASNEKLEVALDAAQEINSLSKKIDDLHAEESRLKTVITSYTPWLNLDIPMDFNGLKTCDVYLCTSAETLKKQNLDTIFCDESGVYYEIISANSQMSCILFICLKKQVEKFEKKLRENGFAMCSLNFLNYTPKEIIRSAQNNVKEIEKKVRMCIEKISSYSFLRDDIKLLYDKTILIRDKYRELFKLVETEKTFILEGYIPDRLANQVKKRLTDNAICDVVVSTPEKDEDVPVLLQNSVFAQPVEGITKTYSSPSKKDIDPNGIMAFFYYLFFGMMFSDAGYGLIMILATTFALKKLDPEKSMAMSMRLFRNCGISTFLWGIVYASFFGDAIGAVAKTFFGADLKIPCVTVPLLDPIQDALPVMIISVAFGLVQILAGMGAKFYVTWRKGDKWGALFDTGLWMLMLTFLGVLAAGLALGQIFVTIGGIGAVACALGLVLTQGRSKKGPMKIVSGLASLYDITSYISDLMSYTRLLALGLTTAVMGQVFNVLSLQFSGSPFMWIFMVLVFVVGHVINFGLNVLGSYVHTMRLQYVEMFSKFYDGGGKKFTPFAVNGKYTRLQEENKS